MSAPTIDPSAERAAIATLAAHNEALERQKTMTERLRTEAGAADKAKAVALATSGAQGDADAVSAALLAYSTAGHALDVAEQVQQAMEGRAAELRKAVLDAHADAHLPLRAWCQNEALAAAGDGAAALRAYGEACQRYREAAAVEQRCFQAGLKPLWPGNAHLALPLRHPMTAPPPELRHELPAEPTVKAMWGIAA